MVKQLESFQERITRTLTDGLKSAGETPTYEEDFNTVSLDTILAEPVFTVRIQLLPETIRLRATPLRITVMVGVLRSAGNSPFEQTNKLNKAVDNISRWIRAHGPEYLQGRNFRTTNKDTQQLGPLTIQLLQFECIAFLRKGEY
jgi:hypothetical protein